MNKLRVAVAGAGWVSAHHLAGWRRLPDVDLVAICDPAEERAAAAAARWGIPNVYTDAAAMLAEMRLDALDIAAPLAAHASLCVLAADFGVHVLCQKPLCPTFREAQQLLATVADRVRLMVHENWRFRPHYRLIKQWLSEGAMGIPLSCRIEVRASGLLPDIDGRIPQLERQPFFATLPRLLIGEVLVHHLDLLRWMLGTLTVAAVRTARRSAAVRGEDTALLVLYGRDCWATIDANLAYPGAPSKTTDVFELVGSRGVASFANGAARLAGERSEEIRFDPHVAYLDSYAGAIAHFVHALRHGSEFETSGPDHLETLALVEAAYKFAQS